MDYTISVIIPVLNSSATIEKVLKALLNQTYGKEHFEIVVVDNGSEDQTPDIAGKYPVKLLFEKEKKGPYAARNKGFRKSSSEIIALLDANKIPAEDWLEEGVKALEEEKADMAGGNILFDLGRQPSASEIYDAIAYNNNKKLILQEQGSAAGNLFIKRHVVSKIGLFPEGIRSGLDIWWTQRAVREGYRLVFAENARVYCQPRNFGGVMKKSYRVGVTHPLNMKENGKPVMSIFFKALRTFAPPSWMSITEHIIFRKFSVSPLKVWLISWAGKSMMALGRLKGLLMLSKFIENTRDDKYRL